MGQKRIYDGRKIAELMLERGMSMQQVAKKAGITAASVWALVHEHTGKVKFSTLAGVAEALGVPIQAILSAPPVGANSDEELRAVMAALSPINRAAILAAATSLLDSQAKKK